MTVATRSRGHHGRPWKRVRAEVLRASDVCWICGKGGATSVDHVVPVSLDPSRALDPTNLRPAHLGCNSARGNGRRGMPTSRPWLSRDT
jgi:5-methylcytosine-specific restriction endonuclease McrA